MEIRERAIEGEYYWPSELPDKDKCLFMDIETTGLSAKKASIYMIGVLIWKVERWNLVQYFAERPFDEQGILKEITKLINNYDTIITFNGNTFDLPFIASALKQYGMDGYNANNTFDLFRKLSPFKNILGLEKLKQVSFEERIGLGRVADSNGGELIKVYEEFLKDGDNIKREKLFYHNGSDVENMLKIMEIFKIKDLSGWNYYLKENDISNNQLKMLFETDGYLSFDLEYEDEGCSINLHRNELLIKVPVCDSKAKLYFENYKDYYYLPYEDKAIHKNLAVFVENKAKEKAKRHTAYSWEPVDVCIKYVDRFVKSLLIYHIKM